MSRTVKLGCGCVFRPLQRDTIELCPDHYARAMSEIDLTETPSAMIGMITEPERPPMNAASKLPPESEPEFQEATSEWETSPNTGLPGNSHYAFNPCGHPIEDRLQAVETIARHDVAFLEVRERAYDASWCKEGGVGAWFNIKRKIDRLINAVSQDRDKPGISSARQYDIFEHAMHNPAQVLNDLRDLRRYLLLTEAELVRRHDIPKDEP